MLLKRGRIRAICLCFLFLHMVVIANEQFETGLSIESFEKGISNQLDELGKRWSGESTRIIERGKGKCLLIEPGGAIRKVMVIPSRQKFEKDLFLWISADLIVAKEETEQAETALSLKISTYGKKPKLLFGRKDSIEKHSGFVKFLIPSKVLNRVRGKRVVVEIQVGMKSSVCLGNFTIGQLPVAMPERSYKPRHSEFIDLNAIGLVGRTANHWPAMQVFAIEKSFPAAKSGLGVGQIIIEVDGRPLPRPVLNATKYPLDEEWLANHHEPFIAKLYMHALKLGRSYMTFKVLDPKTGGKALKRMPLPKIKPSSLKGFPLRGKMGRDLYDELIQHIVREQNADGSWGMSASMGDTFGLLALLGTHDPQYKDAIYKSADYLLSRGPSGGNSSYLELWSIAFPTIAIGEYALATNDPRALAWLDTTCNGMTQGAHVNKARYMAFGHCRRGLPYGTGGLLAPLSHLIVGDALAYRAGIRSDLWEAMEPYIYAAWADNQPLGKQAMGYGAPSSGGGSDQAWCRSGLIASAVYLRGVKENMRKGLVAFMGNHHGFMRRSHGYGNPGGHLGLMGLAGADPKTFHEVIKAWAPMFLMQWQPGMGLKHVESQITNIAGADPVSSARIFSYSMAVVLSAGRKGLHVTGSKVKGWLPMPADAVPPRPVLVRSKKGVRPLRTVLLKHVTPRYTVDGSAPTSTSRIWSPGIPLNGNVFKLAYEGENKKMGPVATISLKQNPPRWRVVKAECGFPKKINGIDNVEKLSVERAQLAFDDNPKTWFRVNNGIRDNSGNYDWSVTLKNISTENCGKSFSAMVIPPAPEERAGVNDSVNTVKVEVSSNAKSWRRIEVATLAADRKVKFKNPVKTSFLRLTFTSNSKSNLIVPDIQFLVK